MLAALILNFASSDFQLRQQKKLTARASLNPNYAPRDFQCQQQNKLYSLFWSRNSNPETFSPDNRRYYTCCSDYEYRTQKASTSTTKDNYTSLWVSNYADPGNIIDAENAIYLKNDALRSPMGLNTLAVETEIQLEPILNEYGGTQL